MPLGMRRAERVFVATNAHVARRSRLPTSATKVDADYVEYSQREAGDLRFGEYLVERDVIDRYQLLRTLQHQDVQSMLRLGEAAAMLGYIPLLMVEVLYEQFVKSQGHHRPPRRAPKPSAESKQARDWCAGYEPPICAARPRRAPTPARPLRAA
jgi:hypothetical protein